MRIILLLLILHYVKIFTQKISLGLFRSDYMLHGEYDIKILQVEFNTIASSFAALASKITEFHRYVLKDSGYSDKLKNVSPFLIA